jgi:hypothetical protein
LTKEEASLLVAFLRVHLNDETATIEPAELPIASNTLGVGTIPTGGGPDHLLIADSPDYDLPFKVSGFYDVRGCEFDETAPGARRAVRSDHPLEIARSQLDAVAPLVTGDPETTLEDLIDDPARRRDLDELTDAEVLRRAAREAAIATALVANAIKDRITTSDFDLLELTPALSALGQSMHALPRAFEQAIDLQEAERRTEGSRT